MAKRRVEDCFALSLDELLKALPDRSLSTWNATITFASREVPTHQMLVRRQENQLNVTLGTFGFKYVLLRQSVTIDPRRRGGYREFLVCPGCVSSGLKIPKINGLIFPTLN